MNPSRRGLFGLFAGAIAAPYLPGLPSIAIGGPAAEAQLSMAGIVAATMRARSGQLAAMMIRESPLLRYLKERADDEQ